jgi:hypothetical protein
MRLRVRLKAMTIFGAFASAFLTMLAQGGICYYVFKHFASRKAAALAAFWLTFGTAGGRYSHAGPLTSETAPALGAVVGAGLALVLLWLWLLKRQAADAIDDNI